MKKIGLALSGGGFRATLYHLGLVRFLRDAKILPSVTHITSVSGGSIFAAHLVLNWSRYNGSDSEFDAAAAELLAFVRLDVRNRIVRRCPFAMLAPWPRRLHRRLTRTGLLQSSYENFLYGDVSLFQLPESPQLHILATNLSEGCLCSFNRDGLLMLRRHDGKLPHLDHIDVGLATVAMAVTASSAFPGFFPPLELTAADVGNTSGEFFRSAYTDGGVFDNLGVRMFRCLEPLLKQANSKLDGVIVSDVGKRIEVRSDQRTSGFIGTALRATDILMDRVWQLENDTFAGAEGFVFAPITDVVDPHEDPTALHPEIQHQAANIRTDLDCFSMLEVSSLIRHGYCVGRKACRAHPALFGNRLPMQAPWDPVPPEQGAAPPTSAGLQLEAKRGDTNPVTREARSLQASAARNIWGRLLHYRDWVSYLYVPILVPILFLAPILAVKSYQRSARLSRLVDSLSQGSHDLEIMSQLMEGPIPSWIGETAEVARTVDELDYKGFEVLQDSRIIDMRAWNPTAAGKEDPTSLVYGYRRVKVRKLPESAGNTILRLNVLATHPKTQVRFPVQELQPKLLMSELNSPGDKMIRWEVNADLARIPEGELVDLNYEFISPGNYLTRGSSSSTVTFTTDVDTAEVTRWFLLPHGKEYSSFRIRAWKTGKPETVELVKVVSHYLADDSTILAYKLLSVKAGYTHEVTWFYR